MHNCNISKEDSGRIESPQVGVGNRGQAVSVEAGKSGERSARHGQADDSEWGRDALVLSDWRLHKPDELESVDVIEFPK
jgi:hypothetical protein